MSKELKKKLDKVTVLMHKAMHNGDEVNNMKEVVIINLEGRNAITYLIFKTLIEIAKSNDDKVGFPFPESHLIEEKILVKGLEVTVKLLGRLFLSGNGVE